LRTHPTQADRVLYRIRLGRPKRRGRGERGEASIPRCGVPDDGGGLAPAACRRRARVGIRRAIERRQVLGDQRAGAANAAGILSKTPGRTQNINFFRLRSGALLADLPGYGYAEVPAAIRRHWQHFIARYLAERVPLTGLLLVMDARRAMTDLDRQMLDWFLPSLRPTHILLTKADKFTVADQRRILASVQRASAR
jgi:hypothetical protein